MKKHIWTQHLSIMAVATLFATLTPLPLFSAVEDTTGSGAPPNIIVILMDDFGYNDVGAQTYPSRENYHPHAGPEPAFNRQPREGDPPFPEPNLARLLTPQIDRIADQGIRLTSFYASKVCSPARASFLTGRYERRLGVPGAFFPNDPEGLSTEEVTIAELLRQAGYATGMTGKWHLGYYQNGHNPMQYMPTRHGFQEFYGVPHSNDMWAFHLIEGETVVEENFNAASEQSQLTWRYTEWALDFIERKQAGDRPFFLYLAHTMPHMPVYPSDQTYTNADGTVWPRFLGASGVSSYYDVVMETDHSVGRIIERLEALGIDEETLVIFTSDNGPWLNHRIDLERNSCGSAYPLRDSKFSSFEGGPRVPFVAYWPGEIPPGQVSDEVSGLIDLLPTFAGLAGAQLPADRTIDGGDLWPLLSGEPGAVSPRRFHFIQGNGDAIRKGHWKLRAGKLYNLQNDPQESTDVSAANPSIKSELQSLQTGINASIAAENQSLGAFTNFEVTLETDELSLEEGKTAALGFRLSADPGGEVTVGITHFSGDSDLMLSGPSSFVFDSANWQEWQSMNFTADPDSDQVDSGATFRVTSPQLGVVREIFVHENDRLLTTYPEWVEIHEVPE